MQPASPPQRRHRRGPPLSSPAPPLPACSHAAPTRPGSLRATGRVPSHALLPPDPRVVCEIILCFTHALERLHRKARVHLSHSVLSEAPGPCCFSRSASVGSSSKVSAAAFMPVSLLSGTPVSAAVEDPKHVKASVSCGFAVLRFTAQPGMGVQLGAEFPPEFLVGRRQTRFTNKSTVASAVAVIDSCLSQSPDTHGVPEAIAHQSPGGSKRLPSP